jgi:hypothetical protein
MLEQLIQPAPLARLQGISFWPRSRSTKPPIFICDTDFVVEIGVDMVKGIAFVFHETDNVLRELTGVQHTYCVSSCFYSRCMSLEHRCSFSSFPSTSEHGIGLVFHR